jgi:protein-S-isoprenylcysteine O-methyltransferase Ste14
MKRLALASPLALTRGEGFRSSDVARPRRGERRRDLGELAAKTVIVTLFSMMAVRLAADFRATGHVTGLLLLASEALVVVLTMFRRSAGAVDRSVHARVLTAFSMFGPPLVKPASFAAMAPETLTAMISGVGLLVVVIGKVSLGRSFGLTPANRGVVCTGIYRVVRHPIYLGYLITHVGFVIANAANWNLIVLAAADVALVFRAIREERMLAQDPEYRNYMLRVPWRVVPGIF